LGKRATETESDSFKRPLCPADIASQLELTHKIMAHWERVLPGKVLRMPYEALVAGQEACSRRLLSHCGLPWDPAVLDFHRTQREVRTASQSQVPPPYPVPSPGPPMFGHMSSLQVWIDQPLPPPPLWFHETLLTGQFHKAA